MQDKQAVYHKKVAQTFKLLDKHFLQLPFQHIEQTSALLVAFAEFAKQGLQEKISPSEIVEQFCLHHKIKTADARHSLINNLLKYIERQIVLFDAVEDAAFPLLYPETDKIIQKLPRQLAGKQVHLVLTAHPTQFYSPQVLEIIQSLSAAVSKSDKTRILQLLLQLGMTPLSYQEQQTPKHEAETLLHHMVNVLYPAIKQLQTELMQSVGGDELSQSAAISLGFWPGGDRDGNPNVTTETTEYVLSRLRQRILRLYLSELKRLRHKLTFKGMWRQLDKLINQLQQTLQNTIHPQFAGKAFYKTPEQFKKDLIKLHQSIITNYQGLYQEHILGLIAAVNCFGFHFAKVDLRQDSSIHALSVAHLLQQSGQQLGYHLLDEQQQFALLQRLLGQPKPALNKFKPSTEAVINDCFDCFTALASWQQNLAQPSAIERYIISNTSSAADVLEVLLLANWFNQSKRNVALDIIPLFETISDLNNAKAIMQQLFESKVYREHLQHRGKQQTIMLGFSDGSKDGGYISANVEILRCKQALHRLAKQYSIDLIFFDGRGGPPARGGGNTHAFYQAVGRLLPQKTIQLTLQGQTITSNFGTVAAARYNMVQLLTATLAKRGKAFDAKLLDQLSALSLQHYQALKDHPQFVDYLYEMTPLPYFAEMNIASRPMQRQGGNGPRQFSQLRAIPFVGAWSQMKQNVPGFYGLGFAIKHLIDNGELKRLQQAYRQSLFFKTLIDNAMQSLAKSNFAYTQYLRDDKKFGDFWQLLNNEAKRSRSVLKQITKSKQLLADDPTAGQSIALREQIVRPLLVLLHHLLQQLKGAKRVSERRQLRTLLLKSMAAAINAARNAA